MRKNSLPRPASLLLSAIVAGLLAGCAPGSSVQYLPFDTELRTVFVKELGTRAYDVGVKTITLSCDSLKTLQIEVGLQPRSTATSRNAEDEMRKSTETSCSEGGALVHVEADGSGGFEVRSKRGYDKDLVLGQWQKALEAAAGTLSRSEPLSQRIKELYVEKLSSIGARDVDFDCDEKSNVVHFRTFLRGSVREGPTTVACPAEVEKGHSVMRLLREPEDYFASASATSTELPRYRGLATKPVTLEFADKVISEFIHAVAPRDKF